MAHQDEDTRASMGFTGEAGHLGGRPRTPRVVDVLREAIEQELREKIQQVYSEALDAETTKFFGPAGEQFAEVTPDHNVRLKAADALLAWAYGKPKQQVEHSGPDGGPIEETVNHALINDDGARELAAALRQRLADGRAVKPERPGAGD